MIAALAIKLGYIGDFWVDNNSVFVNDFLSQQQTKYADDFLCQL